MKNKTFLLLMLAGFLLATQPAWAFDANNWFTGRFAATEKTVAKSQTPARLSDKKCHSTGLKQVMKHFKEQYHHKKQHRQH